MRNKIVNIAIWKYCAWNGITPEELKAFFGLNYLFGLVNKSNFTEYWASNPLVYFPFPSKVMTFQRFYLLQHFICFYDVWSENVNKDPIFKIYYLIDIIIKRSQ